MAAETSSAQCQPPASSPRDRGAWVAGFAVLLVALFHAVWTGAAAISLFWRLDQKAAVDFAYLFQRAYQAAFGLEPCRTVLVTEEGAGLIAGRHFEPILALFVPLVRVVPTPEVLLAGQALLISLSSIPLYRACMHILRDRPTSIIVVWSWLALPLVWNISLTDFRTLSLAIPFLLGCWAAGLERRWMWMSLLAILAVSCREEVMWFLLAGVPPLWWAERREGRRGAFVALLLGVFAAWSILLHFSLGQLSSFVQIDHVFQRIGQMSWQIVTGQMVLEQPDVSPLVGLEYLWLQAGPTLVMVVAAPLWACPIIATWLGIQYSRGLVTQEWYHYYAATAAALPLVWIGGLKRMRAWLGRLDARVFDAREGSRRPVWFARGLATGILVLNVIQLWQSPPPGIISGLRVLTGELRPGKAPDTAWEIVSQVPPEVPVLSDDNFVATLAARPLVYSADEWRPPSELREITRTVSWAVIYASSKWIPMLNQEGFEWVDEAGGAALFRRDSPPPRLEPYCME